MQTNEKALLKYSFLTKGGDIGFPNGVGEADRQCAAQSHAAVRFVCPQPEECTVSNKKPDGKCSLNIKNNIFVPCAPLTGEDLKKGSKI